MLVHSLNIYLLLFISIICCLPNAVYGSSILGQAFKDIGNATGIKEFNKLGEEIDNGHRDLKTGVPLYGKTEEEVSRIFRQQGTKACALVFNAVMDPMTARCSNWENRLEDQYLIADAIALLVSAGFNNFNYYNSVAIRWCPLTPGTKGIAPHRGRLYLDSSQKNGRISVLASLIAHEMKHIDQYRRLGSERFKCKYAQEFIRCGFCQTDNHPLENEAYAYESMVYDRLQNKHSIKYHPQSGWYDESPQRGLLSESL